MSKRRAARRGWILTCAGAAAAGYWVLLSSHSQLVCRFPYRGRTAEKVVALTFDDGPNEPYTSLIGDYLHGAGVRATFFQVGKCVERYPAVTAQLVGQGHVIGNHSYSHQVGRCLGREAQWLETARTQRLLGRAIGRLPGLYRPPWLLRTPTLPGVLRAEDLRPVSGVFCHPFEVFQPSSQRIARRALAQARPGVILIFHDGFDARGGDRTNTFGAVKIVVPELLRRGYRFTTVDELLGVPAYRDLEPSGPGSPPHG